MQSEAELRAGFVVAAEAVWQLLLQKKGCQEAAAAMLQRMRDEPVQVRWSCSDCCWLNCTGKHFVKSIPLSFGSLNLSLGACMS